MIAHNTQTKLSLKNQAYKQLDQFMSQALQDYAGQRNFDFGTGDHSNVSCLSHFIRKRLISEESVVQTVMQSFSLSSVEKYIQEVCWRTYWKGWLHYHPSVWHSYRSELNDFLEKASPGIFTKMKQLESSNSEFECMNDWSRELQETGYMHNHARMWFASIWVHTWGLPWQLGANFFMQHLLDGDEASNTLSWRWVAGFHTKGKAYLASAQNIKKFTQSRYVSMPPTALQPIDLEYEAPIADNMNIEAVSNLQSKVCLIVHGNDLDGLENLIDRYNPESVYVLSLRHLNKSLNLFSEKVLSFDDQALDETLSQLSLSQSVNVISFEDEFELDSGATYLSYFPGQGYVMDYLREKIPSIRYVYKAWDQNLFPYANKGFFPFWKKAKKYIKQGNL